jgi:hypothetical protein
MSNNYNNKISGFQNNSKSLVCIVYDASGNLMDITDYAGYLYMQKYPIRANNPIDASITYASKDASAGSFMFNLTATDLNLAAGDYVYEVIIDDSSTHRYTVIQDRFNLNDSIR